MASLFVQNFLGDFVKEQDFATAREAFQVARVSFPQDTWQVREGEQVIYVHDALIGMTADARLDQVRFHQTEQWLERRQRPQPSSRFYGFIQDGIIRKKLKKAKKKIINWLREGF